MKFTATSALLGAVAPLTAAFPAALLKEAIQNDPQLAARTAEIMSRGLVDVNQATAEFEPVNTFDAAKQYIDVSEGSGHEWVAPGPGDLRGPCPGLNAFANHGFIPHNGYATLDQFINATTTVVGMGPLLSTVLAILGAVQGGDLSSWSIGGPPPASLSAIGTGLDGLHNRYEADVSPTRPDLYEYGNNYKVEISQAQQLLDDTTDDSITINSLMAFRSKRMAQSIANNPYFFNGPFSGLLVTPAAYTFIYRFMANHSEANPTGLLSTEVFKSWFGITEVNGQVQVATNPGAERIPENWYRRSQDYPYELDYFVADILNAAIGYPQFLDVGGNIGTVNSFTGVDIQDLTGGILDGASLFKGNNLACFAFQFVQGLQLDIVTQLLSPVTSLLSTLDSSLSSLNCPQLTKLSAKNLEKFPGYKKSL